MILLKPNTTIIMSLYFHNILITTNKKNRFMEHCYLKEYSTIVRQTDKGKAVYIPTSRWVQLNNP